MNLSNLTRQAEAIVREAGSFINREKLKVSGKDVEIKGLNSLVSYVDKQAEQILVNGLRRILPEAGFITEEDTPDEADKPLRWVIDPLDGTTNYLHGIPVFAVSVGLLKGNEELIGVVYELGQEEMFTAWQNGGAWLDGKRINLPSEKKLADSLIATGFPYHDFSQMDPYIKLLRDLFQNSRGVRRLGSAATDLAYVACGRFDAFFEAGLSPWDVAGGTLIVKEAGGRVSDFSGGEQYIFGAEIVATSGAVYDEFQSLVNRHFNS